MMRASTAVMAAFGGIVWLYLLFDGLETVNTLRGYGISDSDITVYPWVIPLIGMIISLCAVPILMRLNKPRYSLVAALLSAFFAIFIWLIRSVASAG